MKMQALGKILISSGLSALLASCSLAPTYQRPAAPVEASWPAQGGLDGLDSQLGPAGSLGWQDFVLDAQLHEVIGLALEHNRDLRIALHNIERAGAQYRIRRAEQLPTLGASVSGQRSRPNPAEAFDGQAVASSYSVGLGISAWELDLFGRLAAMKDAALAAYLASHEARRATEVSLVGAVTQAWLQLKTDTELLALAERTWQTREQSLDLVRLRHENGASSAQELWAAEALAAAARASRAEQQRLRAQDLNLLTLLVGTGIPDRLLPERADARLVAVEPGEAVPAPEPVAGLPVFAPVPAGLSSEVLLRRPDIRAAEQRLLAANAMIGAARANYFPRIALTASLGRISGQLDELFGSDSQRSWSFSPVASVPLFDFGARRAGVRVAEADRDLAVADYEKAIQSGFREVADALAARTALVEQLDAVEAQARAERERYRLAELRYRNGAASHLDLLDAQRSLFAVEQQLARVQLAERASQVQLYAALGGGWAAEDAATAD